MKASPQHPRTAGADTRFDSLEQEAFLNLWRTYDRLKALEDELFGQHELSAQQYNTLRLLQAAHPGTVPTLALGAQLISRAPDMTRLLDKLEQRKLIHRERKANNRRVVEVSIAAAGLKLLGQLSSQVEQCHMQQLGHMSGHSLRQLVKLLKEARQPHSSADHLWLAEREGQEK